MKELMLESERFMSHCGYDVRQINGQRKSTLRNFDFNRSSGGRTEIFIAKLPRDVFEIELFPIISRAGLVVELRIMMDFSGTTRGFAFAKYSKPEECQAAIKKLNGAVIRVGCEPIGVVESFDNRRLYFGNLPANITRTALMTQLRKLELDVADVELSDIDIDMPNEPRCALVTLRSHEEATKARRILVPGDVKICNRPITIDWAKPEKNDDHTIRQHPSIGFELGENMNSLSLNSSGSSGIDNISSPSLHSIKTRSPTIDFNNNNNLANLNNASLFDVTNYQRNIMANIDILGDRTKQMLSQNVATRPNLLDYQSHIFDPSFAPPPPTSTNHLKNTLTITNINFNTVTIHQLKAIFQLKNTFPIVSIFRSSYSSVTITYTCPEHVEYMLHTLNTRPTSFQNIVPLTQTIGAYRGEIRLL